MTPAGWLSSDTLTVPTGAGGLYAFWIKVAANDTDTRSFRIELRINGTAYGSQRYDHAGEFISSVLRRHDRARSGRSAEPVGPQQLGQCADGRRAIRPAHPGHEHRRMRRQHPGTDRGPDPARDPHLRRGAPHMTYAPHPHRPWALLDGAGRREPGHRRGRQPRRRLPLGQGPHLWARRPRRRGLQRAASPRQGRTIRRRIGDRPRPAERQPTRSCTTSAHGSSVSTAPVGTVTSARSSTAPDGQ